MENFKRIDSHWINPESPWNMIRGKYLFENPKILNKDSKENNLLSLTLNGVLNKDMDSGGGLRPDSYESYQIFYENDLVFKLIDLENVKTSRVGWVHERGLMSPVYIRLKPKEDKTNTRYFYYYFFDLYQRQIFNSIGSGIRSSLSGRNLLELLVPNPSHEEQNKIVGFLDKKTTQIDKLIKKIEQKLELLKEQKTSLINEVVTKGLNPNVEMKYSGIEWVGKIPTDWDVLKLKRVGKIYGGLTGKSGDDFGQEDSPLNKPYIPYTNIYKNTYISREHFDLVSIEPEETQNNVKRLDLFFLMSSENYDDLGKTSILVDDVGELYLNSFCKGFRVNNPKVNPLFLNYQLNGDVFKKLISINGFGFTRINLRQDKLLSISILLPPLKEQEQIVMYLDKKLKLIDESILKEEKRIELLKEYKKSLISEVVTGKKRVV